MEEVKVIRFPSWPLVAASGMFIFAFFVPDPSQRNLGIVFLFPVIAFCWLAALNVRMEWDSESIRVHGLFGQVKRRIPWSEVIELGAVIDADSGGYYIHHKYGNEGLPLLWSFQLLVNEVKARGNIKISEHI